MHFFHHHSLNQPIWGDIFFYDFFPTTRQANIIGGLTSKNPASKTWTGHHEGDLARSFQLSNQRDSCPSWRCRGIGVGCAISGCALTFLDTWDVQNPVNSGISYILTGAKFLPSVSFKSPFKSYITPPGSPDFVHHQSMNISICYQCLFKMYTIPPPIISQLQKQPTRNFRR